MAGTAAIFRIDANGETEVTAAAANEIIEFNTGATNPDTLSKLQSSRLEFIEDISIHPNPNRALSQIQDGKLGTQTVKLSGFFQIPSSSGGITKLFQWMTQDKTVDTTLPNGRFGIRVDNMSQLDLTPSTVAGYILQSFWVEDIADFQSLSRFEVVFYRNGVA